MLTLFSIPMLYYSVVYLTILFGFSQMQYVLPSVVLLGCSIIYINKYPLKAICLFSPKQTKNLSILITILLFSVYFVSMLGIKTSHSANFHYSLSAISLIMLVPIAEELFFRGIVFEVLQTYLTSKASAVLINSLLFASAHYLSGHFIEFFIFSIIACSLLILSESLILPIIFHILWNCVSVLLLTPVLNLKIYLIIGGGLILILQLLILHSSHYEPKTKI